MVIHSDPFAPYGSGADAVLETHNRYSFWPSVSQTLPLMEIPAHSILTTGAAATSCEGLHSVAVYIHAG